MIGRLFGNSFLLSSLVDDRNELDKTALWQSESRMADKLVGKIKIILNFVGIG